MADIYREEIINPNDAASKLAHQEVCIASYGNSKAIKIVPRQPGNFRGAVDFVWQKPVLNEMYNGRVFETVQNDGAGGKPQFFTLVGTEKVFRGLGWEIITMCADDIARSGGLPVLMANDLNVKRITKENFHLIQALLLGYKEALKQSRLVNITGEIAIMKHSITAFCDNNDDNQLIATWGGTCIGLSRKDKIIDGSKIRPGMPIVGFHEDGYRCNGGTFFTNLLMREYAHLKKEELARDLAVIKFVEKLTAPSKSYARTIARAHGWKSDGSFGKTLVDMVGIAHITGGGIWGKFREMLPAGVGANLNNMPAPPKILLEAQKMSKCHEDLRLSDLDAYSTFHGGCGMLIVCRTDKDAEILIKEAKKDGIKASIVGVTINRGKQRVFIQSRFQEERVLSSDELE